MAKVGGKTGTTVSQPELSPDEEKARVERMVAERNARARQQAVREKRVAAMTIRPGEAPRVQRPTEGEQGRTRPNQTVREEDGEEEEKRETTPEPPRQGRVRRGAADRARTRIARGRRGPRASWAEEKATDCDPCRAGERRHGKRSRRG
ncbi:hypothetical protein KXD40_006803 [Peronospora effusa]|nr:hypothetical protein KXD40_006803 [Peronospora effusa]